MNYWFFAAAELFYWTFIGWLFLIFVKGHSMDDMVDDFHDDNDTTTWD